MKLRHLVAFFFPERCPFCLDVIEPNAIACDKCTHKYLDRRIPITKGAGGARCVAAFEYYDDVKRAIVNFKFYNKPQLARQFAAVMAQDIAAYYEDISFDLVTYVPMRKRDERQRGYNQSRLLAKELSAMLHIPLCHTLNKTKTTKKQHHLTKAERMKNLHGAFRVCEDADLSGKRILLIDDIVTTGVTLSECVRALSKAHPDLICCAAVAHAGEHIRTLPTL